MTPDDESVDAFLIGRAADRAAGPCPDPSLVAGFAEGRLLDVEAERVAAHAASCASCREALFDVAGAAEVADAAEVGRDAAAEGARDAAPRGRLPRPRFLAGRRAAAIAAAVLVVLGAGAVLLLRARRDAAPADTDGRLVAAARELSAAEPALFAGFTPLSPVERAAPGSVERGGLGLLEPTGTVLSARPAFRWVAVPGASEYEVTVARAGGGDATWRRRTAGTSLPYPSDVPALETGARYVWTVAVEAVLGGRTESRRAFAVASREDAEAFARARRAIETGASADLSDLLAAHWALRHGLLEEAERLAAAHVAREPGDTVGRETLTAIRRRRGTADAGPATGGAR